MEKKRHIARRWCIPPAMTYAPGETLEAASLLGELQGDFGVLLWRTVRDLSLWVATPPKARAGLFAAASADVRLARLATTDVPARIAAPIDTIQGMLTRADRADAGVLTICCLEIAAWAREAGVPHTAVAFAQAGALVSPDFAEAALRTGMAALAVQQDARAATWFRRAVALARREADWATYAAGLIEAATVEERRGAAERAEQLFRLASRAARRFKNPDVYVRAALGHFRLARGRGDAAAAAAHARSAARAFRPEVELGPDVLLDLSRFWMEARDLDKARSLLRRLVPRRAELSREDQLSSWALSARVFATADPAFSTRAVAEAWDALLDSTLPDRTRLAAGLHLAHAARQVGDEAGFTRAKNVVLALAPGEGEDGIAAEVARLWAAAPEPAAVRVRRANRSMLASGTPTK
jgi:tetratricopeptide (TPR) repeat protein